MGECRRHAGVFSSYRALGRLVYNSEASRLFSPADFFSLLTLLAGQEELISWSTNEAKA